MARRNKGMPQEPGYVPYQATEERVIHRWLRTGRSSPTRMRNTASGRTTASGGLVYYSAHTTTGLWIVMILMTIPAFGAPLFLIYCGDQPQSDCDHFWAAGNRPVHRRLATGHQESSPRTAGFQAAQAEGIAQALLRPERRRGTPLVRGEPRRNPRHPGEFSRQHSRLPGRSRPWSMTGSASGAMMPSSQRTRKPSFGATNGVLRVTTTGELHSYADDEIGFSPGRGHAQVSTWWGMGILCAFSLLMFLFSWVILLIPVTRGEGPYWGALFLMVLAGLFAAYSFGLARAEYRATKLRKQRGVPRPSRG